MSNFLNPEACKIFSIFLFCIFANIVESGATRGQYEVLLYRQSDLSVTLFWDLDYLHEKINFSLQLSGNIFDQNSERLVGFGMSDGGAVTNADFVMIKYTEDGVSIQDSWSDNNGLIHEDNAQDYFLTEYDVTADLITIDFWRYFQTFDEHDYQLDNGTTHLVCLIESSTGDGTGVPADNEILPDLLEFLLKLAYKINARKMKSKFVEAQLLKPQIPGSYFRNKVDGEILNFSILQSNLTIPAEETTYWWSIHMLPDSITEKVHGIGFGGDIPEDSINLIHHIIVFSCDAKDGNVSEYSGPSTAINIPDDVKRCDHVMAAWAKGADIIWYPKEAGIPLGEPSQSRFARLEVHYNNPARIKGVVDNSGIKFFYTKNLREYDSGILEVGVTYNDNLAIPPGRKDFTLSGICPQQCTSEGISQGGINIFASQLHTHLAGRKVWVSHVRNGKRLSEINRDDHYSTFFEEIRYVYPSIKVMSGDSLVTYCSYDTSNKANVTFSGLGLLDEMCVSYLHYFPLTSLEVCKSSTSTRSLAKFFLLENLLKGVPEHISLGNYPANFIQMNWDNATSDELERLYETARQDVECLQHNGSPFEGEWHDVTVN
uniref:dopamine beta-hydroxylase-like n=1 Tax=Styela clava TaxID=7725 RepID=UPI00193A616A|nr:dopamine beta-hydroxylase-like [Styela clava]